MSRPVSLLARFSLITVVGALCLGVIGAAAVPLVLDMPKSASFEVASTVALPELAEGSTVLDMNGDPMGELVGAENRVVVGLEDISHQMQRAVIANEDEHFYSHDGISPRGILRALRANSEAGGVAQGGSTITQQLVKLSLAGDDQTIGRKLKEASLAIQLENQLCNSSDTDSDAGHTSVESSDGTAKGDKAACKDLILEQYLNQVYLGRGVYGVEAAARSYFDIPASELNWGQAALLASIIPNPAGFDPINHPETSLARRNLVVDRLVAVGDLTQLEGDYVDSSPMPTDAKPVAAVTSTEDLSYFERKVRDELLAAEWLAPTIELRRYLIFNGGLKITSTMDPRAQQLAEAAAQDNPLARRNPETVVALASVEPGTGAVRAIVGDTSVEGRGVVETAMPKLGRSPGSSFKTFTLLAALEEGHSIRDTILATPAPHALYDDWGLPDKVSTWPSGCKSEGGMLELRRATASSNNCAFVRLQAAVGADKVVDVAQRLGIDTIDDNAASAASLTLGATTVRPLDMAAAYATLANDGRYNPAHFVTKVEDRDGNVIYEYEAVNDQVISVEVAREATVALEGVVSGGTYRAGALPGRQPAAGKTGTNELEDGGNADVWFVGYTPQMATAVWIGNPLGNTAMKGSGVQGGTAAATVWRAFMAPFVEPLEVRQFEEPDSLGSGRTIKDPWASYVSRSDSSSKTSTSNRRSGSNSSNSNSNSNSNSSGSDPSGSSNEDRSPSNGATSPDDSDGGDTGGTGGGGGDSSDADGGDSEG